MRVSVQPLLPTGNYLNVRIGIEKDIPDVANNSNIEIEINQIWDCITAIHMKRYPHLYNEDGTAKYEMYKGEDEMNGTKVRDLPEVTISEEIKATLAGINTCTELEGDNGLKSYWLKSKGNLVLSEAYKTKEKQLTNAK